MINSTTPLTLDEIRKAMAEFRARGPFLVRVDMNGQDFEALAKIPGTYGSAPADRIFGIEVVIDDRLPRACFVLQNSDGSSRIFCRGIEVPKPKWMDFSAP